MSIARDPQQSDFDLKRVIEMLDEALTSRDERIQDALRNLLVIITLTKTQEDERMAIETSHGPLRQMQEDISNLSRSLHRMREDINEIKTRIPNSTPYGPVGANPIGPYTVTGGGAGYAQTWTTTGASVSVAPTVPDSNKKNYITISKGSDNV